MSLTTALAAIAALAAGTAGAVTAYQLAAPEPRARTRRGRDRRPAAPGADRPRFAPCKPPAELKAGRCVANLTRTVVVAGPTTAAAAARGAPGRARVGTGDDRTSDFG